MREKCYSKVLDTQHTEDLPPPTPGLTCNSMYICIHTHGLWNILAASRHPEDRVFDVLNVVSKHLVLLGIQRILRNIYLVNEK